MHKTYEEVKAALTAPGQMFELESSDVRGIRVRTYRNAPKSLSVVYDRIGATEQDALVYLEDRYTYARLKELASQAAAALTAMGCAKGDRVAVAMRNLPEYVFMFWACQQIGVVHVAFNAWWSRPEFESALADSNPKLLVLDQQRYDLLIGAQQPLTDVPVVVVRPTAAMKPGAMSWTDFLDRGDAGKMVRPTIEPDDPATMLFTSGTTGMPKAVVATHRNHTSTLMNAHFMGAFSQRLAGVSQGAAPSAPAQMVALLPLPMFHVGGTQTIYMYCAAGAKMVLMYKWDADIAARLIERERINATGIVPSMLRQLLESPEFDKVDHSSLRSFGAGGAPIPPDLVLRAESLGIVPGGGYGLTETTSAVCSNQGLLYKKHPDSVGLPFPVIDIRIVDEEGKDVVPGSPGELWVRGPNVVVGYLNRTEETAQSFPGDGWFRTGDVARQSDDGLLYIVDRIKDTIIRGGENVFCGEVEGVLATHPAVSEVAVIGIPDTTMGELVGAVVVLRSGQPADEASLIAFARERLAHFKVPSRVVFRSDPFERTATGKLQKFVLKKSIKW